jgi:HSP20 family molecular chaperone IbpA
VKTLLKENKMINIYKDPIWDIMDMFSRPYSEKSKLADTGLRSAVKRPHNLINIKDDDGNVIGQRLDVVTTPFKKEDVKVSINDGMLSVVCGTENIKDAEYEDVLYRGISSQSYSFSLKLDESVDQHKVTAENKDGILKINLPLKKIEEKKPEEIEIEIK